MATAHRNVKAVTHRQPVTMATDAACQCAVLAVLDLFDSSSPPVPRLPPFFLNPISSTHTPWPRNNTWPPHNSSTTSLVLILHATYLWFTGMVIMPPQISTCQRLMFGWCFTFAQLYYMEMKSFFFETKVNQPYLITFVLDSHFPLCLIDRCHIDFSGPPSLTQLKSHLRPEDSSLGWIVFL